MPLLCRFYSVAESELTFEVFGCACFDRILVLLSSWQSRIRVIYRATKQHALNLAKFVSLYKSILLLQKKLNGGKERDTDTFIAGLIGGYFVFGERNAVNEQVCRLASINFNVSKLYLFSDRSIRGITGRRFIYPSRGYTVQLFTPVRALWPWY